MDIIVVGYGGSTEITKVKDGYDVVICIPFISEKVAQNCLDELVRKNIIKEIRTNDNS